MRKTFLAVATMAVLAAGCSGVVTGSGEVATETRQVDSFDSVELRGSGELTISIGDEAGVVVEADSALIDRVTTDVDDGRLVLDQEVTQVFGVDEVSFDVTVPTLDAIYLSGSGTVTATELTDSLEIGVSGSGDVTLAGSVDELIVALDGSGAIDSSGMTADSVTAGGEGSGEIEVAVDGGRLIVSIGGSMNVSATGTASDASIGLDGSGEFSGSELTATTANVDISGSGSVEIAVDERLEVELSGSGEVTYYGDPEVVTNISGSGEVTQG